MSQVRQIARKSLLHAHGEESFGHCTIRRLRSDVVVLWQERQDDVPSGGTPMGRQDKTNGPPTQADLANRLCRKDGPPVPRICSLDTLLEIPLSPGTPEPYVARRALEDALNRATRIPSTFGVAKNRAVDPYDIECLAVVVCQCEVGHQSKPENKECPLGKSRNVYVCPMRTGLRLYHERGPQHAPREDPPHGLLAVPDVLPCAPGRAHEGQPCDCASPSIFRFAHIATFAMLHGSPPALHSSCPLHSTTPVQCVNPPK